jgi:hypothetical protein
MAKAKKKAAKKKAVKKPVKKTVARPAKKQVVPVATKTAAPKFTARTAMEIMATFVDSVGLTAKVAAALAASNVNILAGTGYSASGPRQKAIFTLIVDDLAKAERALDMIGAEEIQDSSVILVETENKVGALERIAKLISEAGIMIYYFYSTTSTGKMASCVIRTADDKKAIKILQKG